MAAVSPVTAVGATLGYVGLTTERYRSGTTVTTFYMDLSFVDERCHQIGCDRSAR